MCGHVPCFFIEAVPSFFDFLMTIAERAPQPYSTAACGWPIAHVCVEADALHICRTVLVCAGWRPKNEVPCSEAANLWQRY